MPARSPSHHNPLVASGEPVVLVPAMLEAVYLAHVFAPAATPAFLHGESGTGKTFFAEYMHRLSGLAGPFHAFSVGTMAPQLAEDELFGHVQGAYTDARRMRCGRIAAAAGGTLLLDDLHTLDPEVQKKLFQAADRRTYSPVGTDRILTVTCRMVFAMTEDPDVLMRKGVLAADLRYRLRACGIRIPPLRERRAEIPLLAQRALMQCPVHTKLDGPSRFSDGALALLQEADYPGNVRELEGAVEYGFLVARFEGADAIEAGHLPRELHLNLCYRRHGDRAANGAAVERALRLTAGNVTDAARLLGVSRNTVQAVRARVMPGSAPQLKPTAASLAAAAQLL